MGLRAMEGRLLAEQVGSTAIAFHPDLVAAAASDASIRHHITAQVAVMQSRRESLAANVGAIDEAERGQRAAIEGYASVLASRADQAALLEREISGMRGLVAEGYAPANKQLELERALADITATIADLRANRARAQSGVLELRQRAQALRSEHRKEVDMQLAEVRREVQAENERYGALREELGRTEIRATATGQVVGLAIQTVGGVVQAGQKLMDIVPLDERLVLEAHLATHLIDRVRPGAKVDVRFSAFAHSPQLVVEGKVDSISADALTDPITNVPYYLARVSITQEGQAALGTRRVQPGMPIEVVVKTGERSLLTYLLHPLIKRLSASMKEE
jgi:protease secretion system membrane fusion protein